ncbi:hypothetical protein FGE12_01750 [Aggregicoccus sp. 17bor-14]|uniref:hypothetical protein n=1 Tax=Myxococcaceae TaxID=31 RepID=UPI00129C865F|nr:MULTISPECIES: hypothetical protein [Myxococcaceae]MBF5041100.1 hypothetical protein [Simulacricoccus sp. 17bor-14]MRI86887.1 hypothetical protein [Aggregicoccus sp. 17bor-14]
MRNRLMAACVVLCAPAALAGTVFTPSLKVTAEERYDTDLRLRENGAGGQLMSKLSPRLGLEAKDPTLVLDSFYAADAFIRHGSGSTSLDHRAGVDLKKQLSRNLRLDTALRVFRVTDPTSLPRQGLGATFDPILYGKATVGLGGRVSRRWNVRGAYTFEAARVYAATPQVGVGLEGKSARGDFVHTPTLEAWYGVSRRLLLGTEYRYQAFQLSNGLDQSHTPSAMLRYHLTRWTTFTARGGPVFFQPHSGVAGGQGVIPRVQLELTREVEHAALGLVVGHDLVGASGFDRTLWADYASLVASRAFSDNFNVFGAASFFRNGKAPNQGLTSFSAQDGVSQGYAVGGGVEYRLNRYLALQGTVDRIDQVGGPQAPAAGPGGAATGAVDLSRNVAAVRAVFTAW